VYIRPKVIEGNNASETTMIFKESNSLRGKIKTIPTNNVTESFPDETVR